MPQLPDTTLDDWLAYLERIHGQAIDLGLDRLARVAEHLDLPLSRASGRRPFVITVAGTNGKGSTCETLRQLGLQAGARVGLYSSPHLHRFNERVVIDRDPVSDDALIQAFKQVEQARGDISLTYFEFTTLAAFVVFHQADLDLWVLEVGLGGRLDAVNLVDCDVAVLTTVDRDHQAFLGDDINIIGQEKAGIFRSGRPAVLGSNDLPATVASEAERLNCPLYRFGDVHGLSDDQLWWQGGRFSRGQLHATVPLQNQATALQAFSLSSFELPDSTIVNALNRVQLPGRLQSLHRHGHRLVLDVGHNPHAARYLAERLKGESWHVVLAMLADKDIPGVVGPLKTIAGAWSLAGLDVPRGLDAQTLRERATLADAQCYDSVAAAIDAACADPDGRPVLICGSFFTVSEALDALA